jgi:N-acetylmuramoyl-L-alanine amidase
MIAFQPNCRHYSVMMKTLLLLFCMCLGLSSARAGQCLVALDAGHDAIDVGTLSARGQPEWRFNRDIAVAVRQGLQAAHIPSFVIATDGRPVALAERPRLAQAMGATLFLSLHHDSAQDRYMSHWQVDGASQAYSDLFSGYGLFVSRKNPAYAQSVAVARQLGESLWQSGLRPSHHHAEQIAGENRPLLDERLGIYRFDDLIVLKSAQIPALLLEVGVLVNRQEELAVAQPDYRDKIVEAIIAAASLHCSEVNRVPR